MKVLDLHCALAHSFEGWFASEDDFQSQLGRGLVSCPLCGDTGIGKKISAPRLNLSGALAPSGRDKAPVQPAPTAQNALQQADWLNAMRNVLANTEDVGSRFADEARRIHYGETEERGIRGQASARETAGLLEEGIVVVPLMLPPILKETLQ